jgi:hypothetical protein
MKGSDEGGTTSVTEKVPGEARRDRDTESWEIYRGNGSRNGKVM